MQLQLATKKMKGLVVSGEMHHGTPGLRGVALKGLTEREQINREVEATNHIYFYVETIKASHCCLTAKCLSGLFMLHYFTVLTATQQSDGETYLGIVGYVMLGQCLRGVHP